MQPGNRREEREDEIVQAGDEMMKEIRDKVEAKRQEIMKEDFPKPFDIVQCLP